MDEREEDTRAAQEMLGRRTVGRFSWQGLDSIRLLGPGEMETDAGATGAPVVGHHTLVICFIFIAEKIVIVFS